MTTDLEAVRKRHEAHRDWMSGDPPRLMAVSQSIEAYQDVAKLLAHIDMPPDRGTVEAIESVLHDELWTEAEEGVVRGIASAATALLQRFPGLGSGKLTGEAEKGESNG